MTKDQYFKFHAECLEKMTTITKAKNADYTGGDECPFANFTRVETMGVCTTEQGFLTRMSDKMARLVSFVQNGSLKVKDETVEDTLLDLANYCILLAGFIKSKGETRPPATLLYLANPDATAYTNHVELPPGVSQLAAMMRAP